MLNYILSVPEGIIHISAEWIIVVPLLSCVWLFATPWTVAHQGSLSFTISQSLLKFMSIKSVMLSHHLILCYPLLLLPAIFPSITVFSNESASGGQSIGVSASASVLPTNIQDRFPLVWTGWKYINNNQKNTPSLSSLQKTNICPQKYTEILPSAEETNSEGSGAMA